MSRSFPLRLAWPTDPGSFRLFLSMIVFVHHFSSFGLGPYAVYVFFVLSGFWVQRMWTDRYRSTRSPYFTYIVSRLWRLAPVMWMVSAISIAVLLALGVDRTRIIDDQLAHLILSTTVFLTYARLDYLPIGSAWSLDVEMQFYLVAPLLAVVIARFDSRVVLAAAAAISLISGLLFGSALLVKYILFFLVGMMAANRDWVPDKRIAYGSALLVVTIVVLTTISPWRGILWGGADPGPLYLYNPQYNIVLALFSIPFALHTVHQKSDPADRMFADLSYIIYLLHWAGMQWFFTIEGPFSRRLLVAATCFVLVPAASWIVWRWWDRPLNRRRAAWVDKRQTGSKVTDTSREPAGP